MTVATHPAQDLSPDHFAEIIVDSAVDPAVADARGYRTIMGAPEDRVELLELGFSKSLCNRDETYPALLVPLYRATGEIISHQLKPADPRVLVNGDGKPREVKYESPQGATNHVDVPAFTRAKLSTTDPLWITEGVKKVDSLVSQGIAALGLTGVYNWRSKLGTLGDWEDIPLKGRPVVICFDADAKGNRNVQLAMRRLGAWLESKGCSAVHYLVVPDQAEGTPVKGVDDWFAAGGNLAGLRDAATLSAPGEGPKDASFTDAVLSETVCEERLEGQFCWADGLGWLMWDGHVWNETADTAPTEAVRVWAIEQFQKSLAAQMKDPSRTDSGLITGWRSVLSKGRIKALVDLARGILEKDASSFDANPDVICVKNGYVDLRTGTLHSPDPDMLMTKSAGADYVPGATHRMWGQALAAIPEEARPWYQDRIGQAITGYMTPDDSLVIAHGDGSNGKSTIVGSVQAALGSYAVLVSDRILMASPDAHPTELMDLRGARYAVLEETPEARRLDTHRLKKTVGTEKITARLIRQNDVTFTATHSLFVNTNFKPIITETDHGTWRRLALLSFPYTYRKPGEPLLHPTDREGDPRIRDPRTLGDPAFRRAVLAWAVEGAQAWFERDREMLPTPELVERDTAAWRGETDLIMGFASDMLRFVRDGRTVARDMLGAFNDWTEGQGHKPWTDKTFSARFGAHDVVKRHRVEKRRVRPEGAGKDAHAVMTWLGVTLSEGGDEGDGDFFSPHNGTDPSSLSAHSRVGVHGVQADLITKNRDPHVGNPDHPAHRAHPRSESCVEQNVQQQNGHSSLKIAEDAKVLPAHRAHPCSTPSANTDGERAPAHGRQGAERPCTDLAQALASEETRIVPGELSAERGGVQCPPGVTPKQHDAILNRPVVVAGLPYEDAEQKAVDALFEVRDQNLIEAAARPSESAVHPSTGPVGFDLETRGADWLRADSGFVALAGHGNHVDASPEALCARLRGSETFVGANVYGFDLLALERHHGLRIEETTGRIRDVQLQALIADPPTSRETTQGPAFKSYSLDALGTRLLGRPKDERGTALAAQFCTTPRCRHGKSKNCNGWENIPGDHPDYRAYCQDDVSLVRSVHDAMPWTPYMEREMRVQAIMARMTLNGFRVDEELLVRRIREGNERKQNAIRTLSEKWGAPMGTKSPLATNEGKDWLRNIYVRFGVTNPPLTEKGRLATGAEVLKSISEHPKCPAELKAILNLMGDVTSARTIYQTIADHVVDGRVHPDIWPRQASGRWSVGVGMTVMKKEEREVYIPDDPGESIITMDLGQVDARIVAAHAQDAAYLELFAPGRDIHTETAIAMLGDAKYRNECKPISHLANYGGGKNKLISMGHDPKLVNRFFEVREEKFPGLLRWQDKEREIGASGQLLDNGFGRPLRVEKAFSYTQAPAAVGQSGTRDMMAEGLLRLAESAPECLSMLRAIVHDEIVLSVPTQHAEEISRIVVQAFECDWAPKGADIPVHIVAEASRPGKNWYDAYGKD